MPIFNERRTLAEIVRRVFVTPVEMDIQLVAVDDGSTDGSAELLAELAGLEPRLTPLRHPANRGKGAALRTAMAHARGDLIVVQDADLEYDPALYPRLMAPILAGKADAVFGSRLAAAGQPMGFWNQAANRLLTRLANRVTGLSLTDMETGAKMVRGDLLRSLTLFGNSFTIEPELTCRLAQSGARIVEIPIDYIRRDYAAGKKIRPVDFVKAVGMLMHCWRLH